MAGITRKRDRDAKTMDAAKRIIMNLATCPSRTEFREDSFFPIVRIIHPAIWKGKAVFRIHCPCGGKVKISENSNTANHFSREKHVRFAKDHRELFTRRRKSGLFTACEFHSSYYTACSRPRHPPPPVFAAKFRGKHVRFAQKHQEMLIPGRKSGYVCPQQSHSHSLALGLGTERFVLGICFAASLHVFDDEADNFAHRGDDDDIVSLRQSKKLKSTTK